MNGRCGALKLIDRQNGLPDCFAALRKSAAQAAYAREECGYCAAYCAMPALRSVS